MDPETDIGETLAQISEIVGGMASVFPSAQMGKASIRGYARMLQDQPIDLLKIAIDQLCVESKYLPSVAEIRDKVTALTQPERPPALQAWKGVVQAIERHGYARSETALKEIEAESPEAAEATRCIGWRELCNSENQVADRAHFSKIYDQLVTRTEADQRLLPAARELKELNRGQPLVAQLIERKGQ